MTADEAIKCIRECAYYAGADVESAGLTAEAEAGEAAIREAFTERDSLRECVDYYQRMREANEKEEAFQRGDDDR